MNGAPNKVATRFDAMKPRERVLVFVAGAAIIACLAFVLGIDAALTRQKALKGNLNKQQAELAQLQAQNSELVRSLAQDPDVQGRKRIQELRHELSGYDTELRSVQEGLVAPDRMVKLLEGMLTGSPRVHLVKLHTIPSTPLIEPATPAEGGAAATLPATDKRLVYKHGIELTVQGNYLDLLEYQARLENLPWRMFFARTSIDSTAYPRVLMTVTLYTLSLEETWLVV